MGNTSNVGRGESFRFVFISNAFMIFELV